MPPIQVTEGQNNEYMINDGVTRATRIYLFNKINETNTEVEIEVIDTKEWALSNSELERVKDK